MFSETPATIRTPPILDQDSGIAFTRLTQKFDAVVLENNSPRVMRNFGLEYAALAVTAALHYRAISGKGQHDEHGNNRERWEQK